MYKIYRVEDNEKKGPYTSSSKLPTIDKLTGIVSRSIHNDCNHPSLPNDWPDRGLWLDYKCAFLTELQLKRWFWKYNALLKKAGYLFMELTVKDRVISESGLQCFYREKDVISRRIYK